MLAMRLLWADYPRLPDDAKNWSPVAELPRRASDSIHKLPNEGPPASKGNTKEGPRAPMGNEGEGPTAPGTAWKGGMKEGPRAAGAGLQC